LKRIQIAYAALLLLLTALWLASEPTLFGPQSYFTLRDAFIQGTGLLAIGAMSAAVVLSARPRWLEPGLGGLDKMYRLHKWLGITVALLAIAHWGWSQSARWLIALGQLERPARQVRLEPEGAVAQFFVAQRGLAEGLGEWAFYAVLVMVGLALLKRFPYRLFVKTHRLLAVLYLVLVFHAVVLLRLDSWYEPVGVLITWLMVAGGVAALLRLLGRMGPQHQVLGTVEEVIHHADARVLEVVVRLLGRWPGHAPGQFAFVGLGEGERAHPFTITSAWQGDGLLRFLVKDLGDYTRLLPVMLKVGEVARIEGPYGRFDFAGTRPRQIWVGAGIGITPFLARLQQLAGRPDGRTVDLFHVTATADEAALRRLQAVAVAAKVRLHVLVDHGDHGLDAKSIRQAVPQWQASEIWFCGPASLGASLRRDFMAQGLAAGDFHQELFVLR
jgi:predicted ferric reductase